MMSFDVFAINGSNSFNPLHIVRTVEIKKIIPRNTQTCNNLWQFQTALTAVKQAIVVLLYQNRGPRIFESFPYMVEAPSTGETIPHETPKCP